MANSLPRQIIGSFEDIGKDVLKQTTQVPVEIVGKAIESLGTSSGKPQGQTSQVKVGQADASRPKDSWDQIQTEKNQRIKQSIARDALAALSQRKTQKEPSIWERLQQEEGQKREMEAKRQAEAARQSLPQGSSKRRRGDLYGVKAKKQGSEIGKNVKSD